MESPPQVLLPRLPPRPRDAHKGTFGTALIIGGSRGMTGAVALAGMAALRGGAGLVRLAVPDRCVETVAAFEPSYMTTALLDDKAGRIAAVAYDRILELAESATVVALGPGLGRSEDLNKLAGRLYRKLQRPMVIDADALNALSTQPDVLARPGNPRILTPHPGEFARLVGRVGRAERAPPHESSGTDGGARSARPTLQLAEREAAAVDLAARCGIVVVLKGHRTLVTDGRRQWHNITGNPGMATGGSGDSLTGLITALACQGLEPYDAARLGVYLHGLAGDLAAKKLGEVSLIASDLIKYLPRAISLHQARR